jgi:hypothetical protein
LRNKGPNSSKLNATSSFNKPSSGPETETEPITDEEKPNVDVIVEELYIEPLEAEKSIPFRAASSGLVLSWPNENCDSIIQERGGQSEHQSGRESGEMKKQQSEVEDDTEFNTPSEIAVVMKSTNLVG